MVTSEQIAEEFQIRVFDESYQRIFICLDLLSEEDVWVVPNENIPSIGSLVLHLMGNARQWILSGLGNDDDNRDRDKEFDVPVQKMKATLLDEMSLLKDQIEKCLLELNAEAYQKRYTIQGFNLTGFSVIVHVIEHFSYHTGQISTLTKLIKNKDLGYYSDENLNDIIQT